MGSYSHWLWTFLPPASASWVLECPHWATIPSWVYKFLIKIGINLITGSNCLYQILKYICWESSQVVRWLTSCSISPMDRELPKVKNPVLGLEGRSAIKNTGCSQREHRFHSQYPHGSWKPWIISVPEDWCLLLTSEGCCMHVAHIYTSRHIKHTYKYNKKELFCWSLQRLWTPKWIWRNVFPLTHTG